MIDCLIIGDSIAVGTHQLKPQCISYSKVGISSLGWDKMFGHKNLSAETVIISLGSNDSDSYNTYKKLKEIREKINGRVFWIAPHDKSKPNAYQDVNSIAGLYGDTVVWTNLYQSDKIHPTRKGYQELINQIK